ncbi:MAG: hypothetical protein DI585_03125 [Pseudomonas fluorescens]|nr:MAG: hypothetical protein DI585_03125 [Pseudomonas fluorescens]
MDFNYIALAIGAVLILIIAVVVSIAFRTVVETNKVHIVQYKKKTVSYGTGQKDAQGNVYYKWPRWFPIIGLTFVELKVSNFGLSLDAYQAYDQKRVPFVVDVTAFFRIADTNKAAERVSSFDELQDHLKDIVEGAVRRILSSHDIMSIMSERSTLGDQFTEELKTDLDNWGIETVKSMELMDIRDVQGGSVIADIMAKDMSRIAMESRKEVATNNKEAEMAVIAAEQEVEVKRQDAAKTIGEKTAETDKAVGIAKEQAQQEIKAQQATTTAKDVEISRVKEVGQATINKDKEIVAAEQDKATTVLKAEGDLAATKLTAEGIKLDGQAKAEAEKAMQMAPVEAQIALAKEIGSNTGYQSYLISLKQVEALIAVGGKQAEALSKAEVKIIATAGNAISGASGAMNVMSPNGGISLASMLEGFAQMPEGQKLLEAIGSKLGNRGGNTTLPAPDAQ